jgi:hypothetical protein
MVSSIAAFKEGTRKYPAMRTMNAAPRKKDDFSNRKSLLIILPPYRAVIYQVELPLTWNKNG